jgi:UDP-N-acetylmuramoyl-tripeptide--D-alanyl-D-alanine ligase
MNFSSQELATGTKGQLVRAGGEGTVCTDTRKITSGDWFLALKGERFDAHDFLDQAINAGASGVIAERVPANLTHGHIAVEDGLAALQNLGRHVRAQYPGPVVGITGSAGKTTSRAMVGLALEGLGSVHQTAGNFNNHIGLPLTLLEAPLDADAWVLEMGMNHAGEIDLLQGIGQPTVRIITNVGAAHLEGLGNIEAVAQAKAELFDGARAGDLVCINEDDAHIQSMVIPKGCRIIRYGSSKDCDIQLLSAMVDPDSLHTRFTVQVGDEAFQGHLPSPGIHMAHNAVGALAVGHGLGLDPAGMLERIAQYKPVGMRLRIEDGPLGTRVINDAYNANPMSVAANLKTLASLPTNPQRRRIALLGDMLELGPTEIQQHAETGALAQSLGLDFVAFAGPRYCAAIGDPSICAAHAEGLAVLIRERIRPGDILFIKGSRAMKMERVLQALESKESP